MELLTIIYNVFHSEGIGNEILGSIAFFFIIKYPKLVVGIRYFNKEEISEREIRNTRKLVRGTAIILFCISLLFVLLTIHYVWTTGTPYEGGMLYDVSKFWRSEWYVIY